MKRITLLSIFLASVSFAAVLDTDPNNKQLTILSDGKWEKGKVTAPRFEIADISWPAKPGEAEICLWKDDKVAAYNMSIDDNAAVNVPWWFEQEEKYGWRFTWFLVTGGIKESGSHSMLGNWDLWREVAKRGHELGSHTVSHLNENSETWEGVENEYAASKKAIEDNIPGYRVFTLAYPGGPKQGLDENNSYEFAVKHYSAIRGGQSYPSTANTIDYGAINAMSSPNLGDLEKPQPWADATRILRPGDPAYRGWVNQLFHFIREENYPQALKFFDWVKENEDKIWVDTFGNIARYAQQRDTATLTVTKNTSKEIAFKIEDRMCDEIFDFPLTVKVRLPNDWKTVSAKQLDKPATAKLVEHEGNKYALVAAVPDRGEVVLTP